MSESNRRVCGEGLSLNLQDRDIRVVGKSLSESRYASVRSGRSQKPCWQHEPNLYRQMKSACDIWSLGHQLVATYVQNQSVTSGAFVTKVAEGQRFWSRYSLSLLGAAGPCIHAHFSSCTKVIRWVNASQMHMTEITKNGTIRLLMYGVKYESVNSIDRCIWVWAGTNH